MPDHALSTMLSHSGREYNGLELISIADSL